MNDEILNKISDNLLSDAIQLIKQKVGKLESIVLVEGQLAKHNSDVIAGVLSFEQETVSINQIRKKIFEIYNNYSSTFSNKPVLIFLDERDNHIYKAVKLTNKYWTTSNLSYEPKDSMWQNEFIKHRFQDNSFENYYSWKCAMNNIPQGWRIPSEKDWSDLLLC